MPIEWTGFLTPQRSGRTAKLFEVEGGRNIRFRLGRGE